MKWIDQAGYACAAGWAGCYCVTVYVGGIQFERPIHIGQLVEVLPGTGTEAHRIESMDQRIDLRIVPNIAT